MTEQNFKIAETVLKDFGFKPYAGECPAASFRHLLMEDIYCTVHATDFGLFFKIHRWENLDKGSDQYTIAAPEDFRKKLVREFKAF